MLTFEWTSARPWWRVLIGRVAGVLGEPIERQARRLKRCLARRNVHHAAHCCSVPRAAYNDRGTAAAGERGSEPAGGRTEAAASVSLDNCSRAAESRLVRCEVYAAASMRTHSSESHRVGTTPRYRDGHRPVPSKWVTERMAGLNTEGLAALGRNGSEWQLGSSHVRVRAHIGKQDIRVAEWGEGRTGYPASATWRDRPRHPCRRNQPWHEWCAARRTESGCPGEESVTKP